MSYFSTGVWWSIRVGESDIWIEDRRGLLTTFWGHALRFATAAEARDLAVAFEFAGRWPGRKLHVVRFENKDIATRGTDDGVATSSSRAAESAKSPSMGALEPQRRTDLTLRELQTNLPWSVHYSADFRAAPMPHKDMAHALTHVHKAGGTLAALVDDMDHRKETADDRVRLEAHRKYVADLVICALRMANTWPGGPIDLQREVEDRLETKNNVKLPRPR